MGALGLRWEASRWSNRSPRGMVPGRSCGEKLPPGGRLHSGPIPALALTVRRKHAGTDAAVRRCESHRNCPDGWGLM